MRIDEKVFNQAFVSKEELLQGSRFFYTKTQFASEFEFPATVLHDKMLGKKLVHKLFKVKWNCFMNNNEKISLL